MPLSVASSTKLRCSSTTRGHVQNPVDTLGSRPDRSHARVLGLAEDPDGSDLAHTSHTPLGHAGQDALNDRMSEYGGFEHNIQSFVLLTYSKSATPSLMV